MLRYDLIKALFDPMLNAKRNAIEGLRRLTAQRIDRYPQWWQWTAWLGFAITAKRIEDA